MQQLGTVNKKKLKNYFYSLEKKEKKSQKIFIFLPKSKSLKVIQKQKSLKMVLYIYYLEILQL